MQLLFDKICKLDKYEYQMQACCVKNDVQIPRIMSYALQKVIKMYKNYEKKQKNLNIKKLKARGLKINQFYFNGQSLPQVLAGKPQYKNSQLLNLKKGEEQIQFLSQNFRNKQIYIIQYQVKNMLVRGKQLRNVWTINQEQMLVECYEEIKNKNKWNQIARQLYVKSDKVYFRQGKHCRERWMNYLFSSNDTSWTSNEDIKLLQLVNARGKKWRQIVNKFNNVHSQLNLKKRLKNMIDIYRAKQSCALSERMVLQNLIKEKHLQSKKLLKKMQRESLKQVNTKAHKALNILKSQERRKCDKLFQKTTQSVIKSEEIQQEQIQEQPQLMQNISQSNKLSVKQQFKEAQPAIYTISTFQTNNIKTDDLVNNLHSEPLLQMNQMNNFMYMPSYMQPQTFYPQGFMNQMTPQPFCFFPQLYYSLK